MLWQVTYEPGRRESVLPLLAARDVHRNAERWALGAFVGGLSIVRFKALLRHRPRCSPGPQYAKSPQSAQKVGLERLTVAVSSSSLPWSAMFGYRCRLQTRNQEINAVLRRPGATRRGLQAMVPDVPWEGSSRILACLGSQSVIRVVSSQPGLTLQTAGSLSLKLDTCEVPWLCARGGCTGKAVISPFHPGMLGISFLLDYGVPH